MENNSRLDQLKRRRQELQAQNMMEPEEERQSTKGWGAVGRDVKESVKNVYPELLEMVKNLPGQAYGASKQLLTDPARFGKNIGAGLGEGGHGLLSTPGNIRDYLSERGIVSEESPSFRLSEKVLPKEYNYPKGVGIEGEESGDELIRALSGSAPYVAAGEMGAFGTLGRMGTRSLAQGSYQAGQNQNPLTAALMVPGAEVPIRGALSARNLKPTNLFRGHLDPQELLSNVEAAEGTNTPLGRIIGSPSLSHAFENATKDVPFAGGEQILSDVAGQVEGRGESIMGQLGKKVGSQDPNELVKSLMDKAYKEQTKIKNDLYRPVSELAKSENFQVELPTFTILARNTSKFIEDSPLLKTDPAFRSAYNKMLGYVDPVIEIESKILGENKKPLISKTIRPSIAESKMVANRLESEGRRNLRSPLDSDRATGNLYINLAESLKNDINEGINTRGSPELKKAYRTAETNYSKNFSPFLDKEIYKYLGPEKDAQTIVNEIIKPGTTDKYKEIQKVQKLLPKDQQNTLGFSYLSKAFDKEGKLNPKQLAQQVNRLGPRQFKALFPDETIRKQIINYGKLRGMNEEALSAMANPKTGWRNKKLLQGIAAGVVLGHTDPLIGALIGAAVVGGSKYFNHLVTSEKFRQNFVEKMITNDLSKKETRKIADKIGKAVQPAIASKPKPKPWFSTENYELYE